MPNVKPPRQATDGVSAMLAVKQKYDKSNLNRTVPNSLCSILLCTVVFCQRPRQLSWSWKTF